MPGKRKQQQQKFLMEILESETIISLLSFSVLEEIRWSPLEALKKLPVAFLQPLPSRSDSSVEASSVVPPCPAHPCGPLCPACWPRRLPPSLPTPPGLTLGCSAWINLLVFPVQPGDIPSRVASVHLSETTLHMLGEHLQSWVSKDAHGPRVSLPFLCHNYKGNSNTVTLLWRKFSSKYLPHGCYNSITSRQA